MIRGEQPFDAKKLGVEAKDDRTLVVRLATPCGFFTSLVAFPTYNPVHLATVQKYKNEWTRPENMVNNGPFVLASAKLNDKIVFKPNPNYWAKAKVKLTEVVFLPIDNRDTALNKFLAGEVDWIDTVPSTRVEEVTKHPQFRRSPYLAIYYYRFNCTKAPFDDPRVRKAFSMAVDKKAICRRVTKFGELPAGGLIPRNCGLPPYDSVKGLPYDPEGARKLLREAGYAVSGE
jgi:oligopeptide transport system substrate-binding protein